MNGSFFLLFFYIEYNVARNDLNEKDKKVTEKIQQIAMKKKLAVVVWVFFWLNGKVVIIMSQGIFSHRIKYNDKHLNIQNIKHFSMQARLRM